MKPKTIRPTVIQFAAQKEFDEFIDWAIRKPTEDDSRRTNKVKEEMKKHVPSNRRNEN
jgi:hypothetical protein